MGSRATTYDWDTFGAGSYLPCVLEDRWGLYLDPLFVGFADILWVGVQYLIFFNFVFTDALTSPTRRSRR